MNTVSSWRTWVLLLWAATMLAACSSGISNRPLRTRTPPMQCESLENVASSRKSLVSSWFGWGPSSTATRRSAVNVRTSALLNAVTEAMLDSPHARLMSVKDESDGSVKLVVPNGVISNGRGGINATFLDTLDRISLAVGRYCDVDVHIVGHVDSLTGTEDVGYGRKLSLARANEVKKYLNSALFRAGVYDRHVTTEGLGTLLPVATNATEDGRARNQRVEIVLTQPRL